MFPTPAKLSKHRVYSLRDRSIFEAFPGDIRGGYAIRRYGLFRDALRPKTFAVLRCLGEHPGRLVSKEELLRAVWPDTRVSEAGQRDYIRELRKALGDDSGAPQFIETVHGRGYRWIAETRDWRLET